MFFLCRQLECQGQEEEHHWNWPPETPEGRLPQIQVSFPSEEIKVSNQAGVFAKDVTLKT